MATEPSTAEILKSRVAELEQALLSKHPSMPTLLREIHTALKQQPENMLLLTDDEANKIFQGLEVQTNTHLVQAAVGTKKTGGNSLAALKAKLASGNADVF